MATITFICGKQGVGKTTLAQSICAGKISSTGHWNNAGTIELRASIRHAGVEVLIFDEIPTGKQRESFLHLLESFLRLKK